MTNNDFIELFSESIENNKGLSLARLGDGEMYILNENAPDWFKTRTNKEWNCTYEELISVIRPILLNTIKETDIIGLLDKNGYMKHAWSPLWELNTALVAESGRQTELSICDHQIVRGQILGNPNELKKILNGKPIHIISSRTSQLMSNNINKVLGGSVTYTTIPYNAGLEYRDILLNSLDSISENIVVLALSILGKDVPSILSKSGKICLDFGATIDAWAGISTRPTLKPGGLQGHCFITNKMGD